MRNLCSGSLNLLQFVPEDFIDNFLKRDFYLKDGTSYRNLESKIVSGLNYRDFKKGVVSNTKTDPTEFRTKNWQTGSSCFISCFTMLDDTDFDTETGILDRKIVEEIEKVNVDEKGNRICRPFVTVNSKKFLCFVRDLKNQVDEYLESKKILTRGLAFEQVRYLPEDEYWREDSVQDKNNSVIKGKFKDRLKRVDVGCLSDKDKDLLHDILFFLYCTKLDYFKDQRELRVMVACDDKLSVDHLDIPIDDLSGYVKVHKHDELNSLKLEDM